ncbi:MAG: cupin domain-containing protein [Candidatus Acidiferrum sp.]
MNPPTIAPPLLGKTISSGTDGFVVAEWQDPGGPIGERRLIAPLHLHHRDDEVWYVLEGSLRIQVGDREVEAGAGCAVLAPQGTPHTYWNPGPGRVRYLLVMTSNIYQLIQAIHATSDRSPAALQALFRKYDSELLGS